MSVIGHNKPPLDPKETIQSNINRKKPILDRDPQYFNNTPLPSWIELSLIDVCNRACSFCPKSDDSIAPNTHQRMTMALINKLVEDLKKVNFEGALTDKNYDTFFSDRFAGNFGHFRLKASKLIAKQIVQVLKENKVFDR